MRDIITLTLEQQEALKAVGIAIKPGQEIAIKVGSENQGELKIKNIVCFEERLKEKRRKETYKILSGLADYID